MRYFPIFLDLQNRPCLVVGTGPLADEKACAMAKAGARVRRAETFRPDENRDVFLIVAATEDTATALAIRRFGDNHRIFVNVVDQSESCSFVSPAIVDRGNLVIAISTSGKSPALASLIRRELEAQYGPEYSEVLDVLGLVRPLVKASLSGFERRRDFFLNLVAQDLPGLHRRGGAQAVRELIRRQLGAIEK